MSDLFMRLNADTMPAIRALERVGYTLERLAGTAEQSGAAIRAEWAAERGAANELADRIAADAEKQIAAWKLWEEQLQKYVVEEGAALNELVALHDAAIARLSQNPGLATMHAQRIQQLQAERTGVLELASIEGSAAMQAIAGAQSEQAALESAANSRIAKIKEEQRAAEDQDRQRQASAEKFREQISSASMSMVIGGAVILAGTALIADGMYKAGAAASTFDSDILLMINHANATPAAAAQFRAFILAMSPQVGYGPDELAKGLYHVQSALTSLPASMQSVAGEEEVLTQAAHLAKVGHAGLEDTTNALISVLDSYRGTNITAAQAAGILNTTIGEGNMRMTDLAAALKTGLLPVAAEAGVKIQSVGAALATMTDLGIPASRAATYLRSAIVQMTMPSGPAITALEAIGLGSTEAAKQVGAFSEVLDKAGVNQSVIAEKLRSSGSLAATMQLLSDKLIKAGLTSEQAAALMSRAFGGIRSGTGVVSLVDNLSGLIQKENDATDAAHNFNDVWNRFNTQDPTQAMSRLKGGFATMEVDLGQQLLPLMLNVIGRVADFVATVDKWIEKNGDLIRTLGPIILIGGLLLGTALLLGGAIGFLVVGLTAFSGALPVVLGLLGAAAVVMGLVTLAVIYGRQHWSELVAYYDTNVRPTVTTLGNIFNAFYGVLAYMYQVILPQVKSGLTQLWGWLNDTHGPLTDLKKVAGDALHAFEGWMQSKDFANLAAFLAIYLPKAIGVVIIQIEQLIDVIRLAMGAIVTVVRVYLDSMKGDWKQVGKDITEGWKSSQDMITQIGKDQGALQAANADLFSAKTAKSYNDMATKIQLGVEDALRPLPQKTKTTMDAVNKTIDDAKPPAYAKAHDLGVQLSAGITAGIISNQAAINAASAAAVRGALSSARGAANVQSPSGLFRDELGIYLSAGVAAGITAGGPGVNKAMGDIVNGALVSVGKSAVPLVGGANLAVSGGKSNGDAANSNSGSDGDPSLEVLKDIRDILRQGSPTSDGSAQTSGSGMPYAVSGDPGSLLEAALAAAGDRARNRARRGGSLGTSV